jgi:hypothetical protein
MIQEMQNEVPPSSSGQHFHVSKLIESIHNASALPPKQSAIKVDGQ